MPGALFVVATPIGNLEDCSPRALRVLREVSLIAAEDTRVTRKLLALFGLGTPLISYHSHSGLQRTTAILQRIQGGEDVALVSDAGAPGISDPGSLLVREAVAAGIPVSPVAGPSAVTAALSAGGLESTPFLFLGFLPRSAGDRKRILEPLAALPYTLVLYEAPGRTPDTLAALRAVLGDRAGVVAREITKKFEEFLRGSLSELETRCREVPLRGECVLLVAGADGTALPTAPEPLDVDARIEARLAAGDSVRDAARAVAAASGLGRRQVYARTQELVERRQGEGSDSGKESGRQDA